MNSDSALEYYLQRQKTLKAQKETDPTDIVRRQIENLQTRLQAIGADVPKPPEPLFLRALEASRMPTKWMGRKLGEASGYGGEDISEAVKNILVAAGLPDEPVFQATIPWFGGSIDIAPSLPSILGKAAEIFNPLDPINWLTFGLGGTAVKGAARPIVAGLKVPWTGKVLARAQPGALLGPLRAPVSEVLTSTGKAFAETGVAKSLARKFGEGMAASALPKNLAVRDEALKMLSGVQIAKETAAKVLSPENAELYAKHLDTVADLAKKSLAEVSAKVPGEVTRAVKSEVVTSGHLFEDIAHKAGDAFLALTKGLTKAEKDLVADYLAQKPVELSEKLLGIAEAMSKQRLTIENMSKAAELPIEYLEGYFPRIFKEGKRYPRELVIEARKIMGKVVPEEDIPSDVIKKVLIKIDPSIGKRTMFLDLRNPADINKVLAKAGYQPIFMEDPGIAFSTWATRRVRAIQFKRFAEASFDKYGMTIDEAVKFFKDAPQEEIAKWGVFKVDPTKKAYRISRVGDVADFKEAVIDPKIADKLRILPTEIGQFMKDYTDVIFNPKDAQDGLMRLYNTWLGVFKYGTTAAIPGYWARNKTGDLFLMWLGGMRDPSRLVEAGRVITDPDNFKIVLGTGEVLTGHDIQAVCDLFGLTRSGYFTAEIAEDVAGKIFSAKPLKAMENFGRTWVDGHSRITLFLDRLHKGDNIYQAAAATKKYLFDYFDLTPFEKNVMKKLVPFYCVPEDSEILTRDGWKDVDSLEVGEEVLTYNLEKGYLEWQSCGDKHVFDYDQPLMVLKNSRIHLRFTPDHRWAVQENPCVVKGKKYGGKRKIVPGKELNTWHSIIMAAPLKSAEKSLLTPEQARLLGWLMCDGYWRFRGSCCEALIYQHSSKFLDEVIEVAGGRPRKPHPDSGTVAVPVTQERIKPLIPYLDKDNLIVVVTRLSKEALEALYDAMYKADGTVKRRRGSRDTPFFAAAHPGVREAFRVVMLMLGKRTNSTSKTGVYISKRRTAKVVGALKPEEYYKGRVWCPQTPNGTWVMRQNGTITITGNSWVRKNIPLQIEQFIKQPGKYVTVQKWLEALGEPTPREQIPEWLRETMSVPLPGGQYMLPRLPYEDLARLNVRDLLGGLTPFATAPFEIGMGRRLYTGVPIRQTGEAAAPALFKYLFRQFTPGATTRYPETLLGLLDALGVEMPQMSPQAAEWLPFRTEERAARAVATTFAPFGLYPKELAEKSALHEELNRLFELAARLKKLGIEVPTLSELGLL